MPIYPSSCSGWAGLPPLTDMRSPLAAWQIALWFVLKGQGCLLRQLRHSSFCNIQPVPQVVPMGETVHEACRLGYQSFDVGKALLDC